MAKSADKTVYLIGGTTEANRAASRLQSEGYRVVVSVATPLGERLVAASKTDTGPKDAGKMAANIAGEGAVVIVDCAHPFATAVRQAAQRSADLVGVPYLRYSRAPTEAPGADVVYSWEEAVHVAKETGGRALLTIGVRNLHHFVMAGVDFTARILPLPESLALCARLGIMPGDIIAAHPPFSVDFNRACLRHARANILITKDSGTEGGIIEKLKAAGAEGARVIMVARPPESEETIYHLEDLVKKVREVT